MGGSSKAVVDYLLHPSFISGLGLGVGLSVLYVKYRTPGFQRPSDSDSACSADESEDSEGEDEEDEQEEVKMVLVVRNDLKMGKGKGAAQ
jgi:hypothetical protein